MMARSGAPAIDSGVAPSTAAALYGSVISGEAPRVLSLMDREIMSPTIGCCDRTYWAWKFVDFPGARFQEGLCTLAFLYATPLSETAYYRNANLLEWIGHGLEFWSGMQHRDGSFDEAYPFERSLAATAFTAFYVGETLELVGGHLPKSIAARTQDTLARAGTWLATNDESHGFLSNHLAAAAAASRHIFRITGDRRYEQRGEYFIEKILRRQSREGWYDEYGGADPGYQTHGSFYLARYWQLSGDDRVARSLERAAWFMTHFVHADGSLGGEYGSRNTQTYYPAAFEMLAHRDSSAAWIAESMRPSLETGAAAGIRCIDAYNYFPVLNNLVFAYLACAGRSVPALAPVDPTAPGLAWFPEAGLARVRTTRYDAYIGVAKGGVIKVFDRVRRCLAYSDCGYIGRLRDGRTVSSQHQQAARPASVDERRIEVAGAFVAVPKPAMRPARFVAFRVFSLTLGRAAGLGRWLKARLVNALIYRKQEIAIRLTRTFEFGRAQVTISDRISGPDGARVESLALGPVFTTIHMGSSRYFIANELETPRSADRETPAIRPDEIASGVTRQRTVLFADERL
jgi:hypothetical protein